MQEEKLGILEALLGAPLFLRYDDKDACFVRADTGPLEGWLAEHPLPPRVKNRCKAELLACYGPDGTLLSAAGFESGLRLIDAKSLQILRDLPRKDAFCAPVVDGRNRLWVANGECFECYTPELECISRHRLKGSVYRTYCSADGHACALTFQQSKYILRVYRFT